MVAPDRDIPALLAALEGKGIVFFPIRHHSPACAWHVRHWIRTHRPRAVLVEGPRNLTPLIPLLLHEQTIPPIAVYLSYVDRAGRLAALLPQPTEAAPDLLASRGELPRFAAYYPLCDNSPELVALRAGRDVGARLRFIDLTFPEKVLAEARQYRPQSAPRVESLQAEPVFAYSDYVRALARRSGCRDANELWDHLFEAHPTSVSTDTFLRQVAAYCLMARHGCAAAVLEADGTLARERAMAAAIDEEMRQGAGDPRPCLVVTGGIHTAALPFLVGEGTASEPPLDLGPDEAQTVLMRYSYPLLDALNGYASGMPAPRYYGEVWQQLDVPGAEPLAEVAGRLLVEIGRRTRAARLSHGMSAADAIAALQQARLLARMRGHAGPAREDLLDALRSCFVKGAMEGDGALVFALVREVLSGDRVGSVPPEAGVPPLVLDFRREAERHWLHTDDLEVHRITFDLYRQATHRAASRFLRRLGFLNVPFARLLAGPDFARGTGVQRLQEHWEYAWSPATEAALIEASVYGCGVEEAAAARLQQALGELEHTGQARSTAPAVGLLVAACQMGLHRHLDRAASLIERNVAEDAVFASVVAGLGQLVLLWQAREPLEAHHLALVPTLARILYQRACALVPALAGTTEEQRQDVVQALGRLRELAALGQEESTFDRDLLTGALGQLLRQPAAHAAVAGAAAGVLFSEGAMPEEELLRLVAGYLQAASSDWKVRTGFLQGLLALCRELAWRLPGLLDCLSALLATWDDGDFVQALPELRLAFATLTPRETDRVAGLVAARLGKPALGDLVFRHASADEVQFHLELQSAVADVLHSEHLDDWLPGSRSDAS